MRKMKKNSKIFGALLAAVLLCFMAVKVNAITVGTTKGQIDTNASIVTDTATLTVTGVQSGDKFKAYKLLDAFYNQSANTVSYEFTASFKAYLDASTHSSLTVDDYFDLTSGSITSGSTQTTSTLDQLVSGYVSYIKTNSVSGVDMNVSGNTASAVLPAGAYLVAPTETVKVYATMVGNLDFEANGTNWVLGNEAIVAKVSDAGLNKNVTGTEGKNLKDTEFTYTVVGTVPQYPTNATNKVYTIKDTMSEGISFVGVSSFTVKDGETVLTVNEDGTVMNGANQVATITITGQVMTIAFNVNHVTSTTVTVTYKAKMNDNVVLGDAGNKNSAVLTYANDPYGTGTYTTPADEGSEGEVVTRVYGIEVLKYAGTNKSEVLQGAEFDVYADAGLGTKIGTITTGADGIGRLAGVIEGTYYLKETKAPAGYRLLDDAIEVKVKVEGSTASTTDGYYVAEISNRKNGILPFTGGNGLLMYSLFGILIIGVAAYLVVENQKKKKMNVQE